MQIAHGDFQTVVAKNQLEIADKGSIVQGVRGKSVAEMMRRDSIQMATTDLLLDISFMTAPTDNFFGSRMTALGWHFHHTFADSFADSTFREDKREAAHKAARRDTGYI